MDEIMLFIPKVGYDYEEKKDLIFNQLSSNNSIISVNKFEDKEVKILLSDLLQNIQISDDIIPEVYGVQVKKSKPLNFILINNKIKKIIPGALLKEFNYNKTKISILYLTSFII